MSEEVAQAAGNLDYYRQRIHDLNNQLAVEQARRQLAEIDAAALRQPRIQVTNVIDALVGLIDDWNDLAEDDDRGRDNAMLVLTLWDDGSGRLGTSHGYEKDIGSFCDVSMNVQSGFNVSGELVQDLLEWVEHSEVFATEHPGAALLSELEAARALAVYLNDERHWIASICPTCGFGRKLTGEEYHGAGCPLAAYNAAAKASAL